MLQWEWKDKMGEMTIVQEQEGEKIPFKVGIYKGNCMAVFCAQYMKEGVKKYILYTFFANKEHAKNIIKAQGSLFEDEVKNIKLNLAYKDCSTLLNLFVKEGYKVTCYYKED